MVELKEIPSEHVGDLGVSVKEEEVDETSTPEVGDAMRAFLVHRAGQSSRRPLVPGVETLPHGRIPELLGFSEAQALELLPERAQGPILPYLGEGGRHRAPRRHTPTRRSRARGYNVRPPSSSGRLTGRETTSRRSPVERRQNRPSRRSSFGIGRRILPLSTINLDPRYRPLGLPRPEYTLRINPPPARSPALSTATGFFRPPSSSFHRRKYDESTDNRLGRYHPEDARLIRYGVWDAIFEDIGLNKVPPAWWPTSLSYSDFYTSSSSSDSSDSSGIKNYSQKLLQRLTCSYSFCQVYSPI